jgi:U1 small nuclear ribonucleoprotein
LTLFVGRLSYETNEKKLRREFEQFGAIKRIVVVQDLDGKPRGYAFIEFEKEEDLMTAYKKSDGKKIDGRRVVVDVERGRQVPCSSLLSMIIDVRNLFVGLPPQVATS